MQDLLGGGGGGGAGDKPVSTASSASSGLNFGAFGDSEGLTPLGAVLLGVLIVFGFLLLVVFVKKN